MLAAALGLLADRGLAGFTVEAVARRAGAGKATIYRRWSSRTALLVAAMDQAFQPFPAPSTGALRTDLTELLGRAREMLTQSPFPRLMAAVIDAAERSPELADLHFELTERRREPVRRVLEAARGRGEVRADADIELVIDLLTAPLFYRRLVAHRPFPEGYVEDLVDRVLFAIRTPGGDDRP